MSNYLLKLQVNELGAELGSLTRYVNGLAVQAGLTNPLDNDMQCTNPISSEVYDILGAGNITTGNITVANTVTTDKIAAPSGSIDFLSPVVFNQGVTIPSIEVNTINPTTLGGTITIGGPISSLSNITTSGNITGPIVTGGITEQVAGDGITVTGSASFESLTYYDNSVDIRTGDLYCRTGGIYTNELYGYPDGQTINFQNSASFNQPINPAGGTLSVGGPISSTSDITTTGTLTGPILLTSNITELESGDGIAFFGSPTFLNDANCHSDLIIKGGKTQCGKFQSFFSGGTIDFISPVDFEQGISSTSIVASTGISTVGTVTGGSVAGGTVGLVLPSQPSTLIRAAPTPTVGTGCVQVSATANGQSGAWGTVYDTVYNPPPSVGAIALPQVLTAGNSAPTQDIIIKDLSASGVESTSIFNTGNIQTQTLTTIFNLTTPAVTLDDNLVLTGQNGTLTVSKDNQVTFGRVFDNYYNPVTKNGFSTGYPQNPASMFWNPTRLIPDITFNIPAGETTTYGQIGTLFEFDLQGQAGYYNNFQLNFSYLYFETTWNSSSSIPSLIVVTGNQSPTLNPIGSLYYEIKGINDYLEYSSGILQTTYPAPIFTNKIRISMLTGYTQLNIAFTNLELQNVSFSCSNTFDSGAITPVIFPVN